MSVWQIAEKEWQLTISFLHQLPILLLLRSQIAPLNSGVWAKERQVGTFSKLPRNEVLPYLNCSRKLK